MRAPSRRFAVHVLRPWLRTLASSSTGNDDDRRRQTAGTPHDADQGAHQGQEQADSSADGSAESRKPPTDWYKRGVWIDPGIIETRMQDQEPAESPVEKEPETAVSKSLSAMIKYRGGPVTVADYMREVLANPMGGFYAASGGEAIGNRGHFVTAPEIHPMFAEVPSEPWNAMQTIAAWLLHNYQEALSSPAKVALVELGPGRGTLMSQMLRALAMMPGGRDLVAASEVHLVEVSDDLRKEQLKALQCSNAVHASEMPDDSGDAKVQSGSQLISTAAVQPNPTMDASESQQEESVNISGEFARLGGGASSGDLQHLLSASDPVVQAQSSLSGGTVHWHRSLSDVPSELPCIIVANEFLDALPVHIFRRDEQRGWLEVLVDEPPHSKDRRRFEYCLSPRSTKAAQTILRRRLSWLPQQQQEQTSAIEISAEALAVAEDISMRIDKSNGVALLIDYGQDGPYEMSLNAIKNHKGAHTLEEPGTADFTAWVDFDAVRQAVKAREQRVQVLGPITQGQFLLANGMDARVDALQQGKSEEEAENIELALTRLVAGTAHHPDGMGETYKVVAMTRSGVKTPFPFNLDFSAL